MSYPCFKWNGLEVEIDWDSHNGEWLLHDVVIEDPLAWSEYLYENGLWADEPDPRDHILDNPEFWQDEFVKAEKERDERLATYIDRTPEDYDD